MQVVPCGCGILRGVPEGLTFGSKFTLVPCPRCGQGWRGLYFKWFSWRLL